WIRKNNLKIINGFCPITLHAQVSKYALGMTKKLQSLINQVGTQIVMNARSRQIFFTPCARTQKVAKAVKTCFIIDQSTQFARFNYFFYRFKIRVKARIVVYRQEQTFGACQCYQCI